MAKKKEAKEETKEEKKEYKEEKYKEAKEGAPAAPPQPKLPPELEEKLKAIKEKLDKFQKSLLEKFDRYIVGIALLPPPRPGAPMPSMQGAPGPEMPPEGAPPQAPPSPDKINLLVLVDDTEPTRMSKQELKDKLIVIMENIAKEIDPNIAPQTLLLSELWQNCYDGKYELLGLIAMSAPVYDTGMMAAIKISEIHKQMVLRKFEKYIVTYVLAGSLVQGKAKPESDVDVFVVIDDTDVKKMTRAELKDKLRAIIIGMAIEAGEMTGIRNKLNIQVYILTDFWESIREANPVIFTFLRDGVPFYDRGIFMPWKQLLKMGKIRPSAEAIDMYMSSGEQMLERVRFKIRDIGMEDIYYAILTPSQAALMMYGVPPPTPKETPEVMREIFVKKEKLMTDEEVDILDKTIQTRKDLEHGTKKDITGKEIDELLENAEKYLKRIKRLFTQIEKIKEEENMRHVYDTVVTVARDILRLEGVEKARDEEIIHVFEEELISTGKIPAKFLRSLHNVIKAKEDYDKRKLTKTEVDQVRKEANELIRFLVEYLQRKRGRELERTKIKVKYGDKFAEITLLGNTAYIIRDIDAEQKRIEKAVMNPDGSLNIGTLTEASMEEFEQALAKIAIPERVFIKQPIFDDLKKLFGRDVEVLVSA